MDKKDKIKKTYYTQTEVIGLGFTKGMIEELLPTPLLKPNPKYKSASPMKLWECNVVDAVIKTDKFAEYREKSQKRRAGAQKAVHTKKLKLREEIDCQIEKIAVKKIKDDALMSRTIQEKQDWYDYQDDLRGNWEGRAAADADYKTQMRWMVNYVRHNLTSYDNVLYDMSGKVGCHEEYHRYKEAVLDKIAETYPLLAEECEDQKTRRF